MSCYKIEPHKPDTTRVRVGYDSGVKSFYLYVSRPMITKQGQVVGTNDGHVIEYKGFRDGEIKTVEELASLVSSYAIIPKGIIANLCEDQQRSESGLPKRKDIESVRS